MARAPPGVGIRPRFGIEPGADADARVTMDKTAIATEANTTNMFQVTVTGSDAFAGAVNFTATVADKVSGAPLTGWTVSMPSPTVTLTENGTTTFPLSVMVPRKPEHGPRWRDHAEGDRDGCRRSRR